MAAGHFSRGRSYLDVLDRRRGVIDFEALAFAFGLEREGGRIRTGIRSNNL